MLRSGHLNTMYTALYRKEPQVSFERERITTHDNDFLDLDFIKKDASKLAILCHGLEGSSSSKYISGTAHILSMKGFDICAMNYRFCSGEINRTPQMYHSGWTIDLDTVLRHVENDYDEVYLIGFSLGANLVLKYGGEQKFSLSPKVKAIAAVSVPLNLLSASLEMLRWDNIFYTKRFLRTLNHKIRLKHEQFPKHFNIEHLPEIKTVLDFDDYYTGPLNGFKDARDYYKQCSSDQFLPNIKVPTLIINAIDDPFLGPLCYPSAETIGNSKVSTIYTRYGGHVGFYQSGLYCWEEEKIADFFCKHINPVVKACL